MNTSRFLFFFLCKCSACFAKSNWSMKAHFRRRSTEAATGFFLRSLSFKSPQLLSECIRAVFLRLQSSDAVTPERSLLHRDLPTQTRTILVLFWGDDFRIRLVVRLSHLCAYLCRTELSDCTADTFLVLVMTCTEQHEAVSCGLFAKEVF